MRRGIGFDRDDQDVFSCACSIALFTVVAIFFEMAGKKGRRKGKSTGDLVRFYKLQ